MFNENFKRLAEYVIVNNQLLQALLVLQIGEDKWKSRVKN